MNRALTALRTAIALTFLTVVFSGTFGCGRIEAVIEKVREDKHPADAGIDAIADEPVSDSKDQPEPECLQHSDCPQSSAPCVGSRCTDGKCGFTNFVVKTRCDDNGEDICDGNGNCVQCVDNAGCDSGSCVNNACVDKDPIDSKPSDTLAECTKSSDCPGVDMPCYARRCENSKCSYGPRPAGFVCNANGGQLCDGAGGCVNCLTDNDCGNGQCVNNSCVMPSCNDGLKNGNESDVDCGGSCGVCAQKDTCNSSTDCSTGLCLQGQCRTCSEDNDCATDTFCTFGHCVADRVQGDTCTADSQCASGSCADGTCCESACNGTCQACSSAKTGVTDGICAPVLTNTDPDAECTDEGASSCGVNGTGCNGNAVNPGCNLYPYGTTVLNTNCASPYHSELKAYCDGNGQVLGGEVVHCGTNTCNKNTGLCNTGCTQDAECEPGNFCKNAACVPPMQKGGSCSADNECAGGSCVDGVCCDSTCDQGCFSCSAKLTGGNDGECLPTSAGLDPQNECGAATCTGSGQCGAIALTTGEAHSCAVLGDKTVQCWGNNQYQQISPEKKCSTYGICSKPAKVVGLKNITQISAGVFHTCAVDANQTLKCWGDNYDGALGVDKAIPQSPPIAVPGKYSEVATGVTFSCAIGTNGQPKCWGDNYYGQLGDGTQAGRSTPAPVILPMNAATISASNSFYMDDNACAVTTTGAVACWGSNYLGALGPNVSDPSLVPNFVPNLPPIARVFNGGLYTCAVDYAGFARCWGYTSAGIANRNYSNLAEPVTVPLSNIKTMATGERHACALLDGGEVYCWGDNDKGQLGKDMWIYGSSDQAQKVKGISDAIDISAGREHTCALLSSGSIRCWGENSHCQLGNASNLYNCVDKSTPVTPIGF